MAQPCTPTHTLGFYRVLRGVSIPQSSTLLDLLDLTSSWPGCHHMIVGGAGNKAVLEAGNYSSSVLCAEW